MAIWSDAAAKNETNEPLVADNRNYYKVGKWTKDGTKVDGLLYAGNNLAKARELYASAIKHRPRIRLTIRQKTRVLEQRRNRRRRWLQPKNQASVALDRRSLRHSIQSRSLACAGPWLRRTLAPLCNPRTIFAALQKAFR
jgi:hypothetical protein